jgi:2-polyprenyl-6-hydroxyphenyl methylase/3-demethylubiquinone-9 3-methyltransferase
MSPAAGNAATAERLRYDSSHWACEEDAAKALDQYLRLGDKVYNQTKFKLFMALAGDVKGKRILDYGGGAGILAIPLAKAGASVVLVDAEANALRTAQLYAAREGVEASIQTIRSLAFPASLTRERFDIVIAKDIVEHVEEDQQFLLDVSRCQDPSGMLILSTQSSQSLNYLIEGTYQKYWRGNRDWRGWDQTHVRFYTPASLRRRLAIADYRPDRWASVFLVPYNLPSWLLLLKADIELPALHYLDLWLGRVFPFNRWGWNIIVRARRKG